MQALLRASAAARHGHVTFDYAQANHSDYVALTGGVMGGAATRPGLCTALCIVWLDGWRPGNLRAYTEHVESAVGRNEVTTYTNQICTAPNWRTETNNIMGQLTLGNAANQAVHPVNLATLTAAVLAARYTILIGYNTGGPNSHAVAVLRAGQACLFFDPNEGEVHFRTHNDFGNWFFEVPNGFRARCFAPQYNAVWSLQYN